VKYLRDEEAIKQFGKRLKEIRRSKKISQQTLALRVGLEQSQVGRIERCLINTSISHAILLAKGLGVPPSELFTFPEPKPTGKKGK
jgi:transcriptional regulator with XRE-family HTH domain